MKKHLLLQSLFTFLIILQLSTSAIAQRRYRVVALLKNGDQYSGELKQSTRDTLRILRSGQTYAIRTSEINSLHVRRKGAMGIGSGIGAGIGLFVGAMIGYASYRPTDCSNSVICISYGPEFDTAEGAFLGAIGGGLIGLAIASANKEIKIEGNASQMDVFNNEFTPKH